VNDTVSLQYKRMTNLKVVLWNNKILDINIKYTE